MTRERAKELAPIIAAYGEGKEIEYHCILTGTWRYIKEPTLYDDTEYRIKPSPKTRPKTRDEVLGFLAHHPDVVVRKINGWGGSQRWNHSAYFHYLDPIEEYEYATITPEGVIGEAHKFEKEVEG